LVARDAQVIRYIYNSSKPVGPNDPGRERIEYNAEIDIEEARSYAATQLQRKAGVSQERARRRLTEQAIQRGREIYNSNRVAAP
jgi:hypothetical protein